jgi:large subunit ribosomal protein L31
MVELVDTRVLEARTSGVRVQVPLPAPVQTIISLWVGSYQAIATIILSMKKNIHPKVLELKVSCSCGHTFTTSSTIGSGELKVETCSKCHPFYTGEQKLLKTSALDKFYSRQAKAESLKK